MPNYYLARHLGIDKEVLNWLISMNSMGVVAFPDPAEVDVLQDVTPGTVAASKAIVANGSGGIDTTSWLSKNALVLQSLHNYWIPLTAWTDVNMVLLGTVEAAGTMYRGSGALKGELAQNETEVSAMQADVMLPREYRDGGNIKVRCNAKYTAVGTPGTCTVDVEAKICTPGVGPGSDLCTTAAQAITDTAANYDFVITPTLRQAGEILLIIVTLSIQETANGGTVQGEVVPYLLLDMSM